MHLTVRGLAMMTIILLRDETVSMVGCISEDREEYCINRLMVAVMKRTDNVADACII